MSSFQKILLNKQEKKWILEKRITRIFDNKETLIYPMGAERYLASILFKNNLDRYDLSQDIKNKAVLVIPGYGNSAFLFAEFGAKSVTVYDKDPVTIGWVKAFKKYYHYREFDQKQRPYPSIAELLQALTDWYPRRLKLPTKNGLIFLRWLFNPNALRRSYVFYMITLIQNAIKNKVGDQYEWEKPIQFYTGELKDIDKQSQFDTIFVPYLLGIQNGIENRKEVIQFIKQLVNLAPEGHIIITPTQNKKEFYIAGNQYFKMNDKLNLEDIPELSTLILNKDPNWFETQGLAVFGNRKFR